MKERDPELSALLLSELRRHLEALVGAPTSFEVARNTVHALKGSAGLAGERELAGALERVERRLREGDTTAAGDAITTIQDAIRGLEAGGRSTTGSEWPEPPAWLMAKPIDAMIRPQYLAEATDRIAAIDEALTVERDLQEATRVVYRQVHTLKGAASAVGDEPMAWFCHGLEDLLRGVHSMEEAEIALREVGAFRGVLAALVEDPDRALAGLRSGRSERAESVPAPPSVNPAAASPAAMTGQPPRGRFATPAGPVRDRPPSDRPRGLLRGERGPDTAGRLRPPRLPGTMSSRPANGPPPGSAPGRSTDTPAEGEAPRSRLDAPTVRVGADAIDRLIDRVESLGLVREAMGARVDSARTHADRLRRTRASLVEALRLIGPPRPWGAPAAALRRIDVAVNGLASVTEELEESAAMLRGREQLLRDVLDDAKRSLSAMRLTTAGRLFARLTRTLEAEAARLGRVVAVHVLGAQEHLDRRLSEALLEPCMQLVRNAVAHGVEPAATRTAIGKAPTGTITLSARRSQGRVTIVISDDGAGVNAAMVRQRAVEAGHLSTSAADALDDAGIIALLLTPGLSTAPQSDLLAGRGMGLDIVQSAVRRIGGTLRLSSRRQEGFVARIEVPAETGLTKILWVEAGGETYALPATPARAVRIGREAGPGPMAHLASCLDGKPRPISPFAVDLEVRDEADEVQVVTIGVDAVGRTEDLLLRPLSPLVATLGPFAGAIVRGDGSLHLALDVEALAPRVRNLAQ